MMDEAGFTDGYEVCALLLDNYIKCHSLYVLLYDYQRLLGTHTTYQTLF